MEKIRLALLIEDEEIDQRQYLRVIEKSELIEEVKVFTYADEALEFMMNNPDLEIDVIFLDINLPRMDGFEFLSQANEQFGENFAKIVVAMLTTSLNPDDLRRAKQFKVVRDYINKPLLVEHIKRVVAMLPDM